jgi:hypothetical protein
VASFPCWSTILVAKKKRQEMIYDNDAVSWFLIQPIYTRKPPNETVEKPLDRKMFIKISHNRLRNCHNVAKLLCGTPKTRRFSTFLSHFSKIIFEKGLFRQSQRLALPAAGGTRLTYKTDKTRSCEKAQFGGANPAVRVHAVLARPLP